MAEPSSDGRSRAGRCGHLLTVFIAYHVVVLIVGNLPAEGPTAGLSRLFTRYALMDLYRQLTGTPQGWRLFSPNPPVGNEYMRVLVEDQGGRSADVEHDSYGRQTYPYLSYDRLRKVNRRLSRDPAYQPGYAAWVCRTWERTHGGQPAVEVRFVRLVTQIPPPAAALATGGYDPARLPVETREAGRYRCADLPHGQLPPDLRRRFGLAPTAPGSFKKLETPTWWEQRAAGQREIRPDAAAPADESRGIE